MHEEFNAVNDCIFCNPPPERVFLENELAYALWDAFPVTRLHCLIIPRRHAADYFGVKRKELLACNDLLHTAASNLQLEDPSIEGFNMGVNVGRAAGQTIFHCHFHLIPRRMGDVENPRGGIRHTIPGKGNY